MQQSPHDFVTNLYKHIANRGNINRSEYLRRNRIELEKPIFNFLRANYLQFFRNWWVSYILPQATEAANSIVIYETRQHENLEFLIYNSTYYCPNWTLTIYCTHQNYDFICAILAHNKDRAAVHIVNEKTGEYTSDRNTYISFMKSAELWDSLQYKYVLLLEMDAYLVRQIPVSLTADYYCAAWPWHPDLPGGSGLTIRNVATMREICARLPESANAIFDQDYWAGAGIQALKKKSDNSFFVEAMIMQQNPIGVHQWWTFIEPIEEYRKFYIDFLTLKAGI